VKPLVALAAVLAALASPAVPARIDVGEWSYGLAVAGGSMWVGGLSLGDIVRVDPVAAALSNAST
jgi:hypothetical protein